MTELSRDKLLRALHRAAASGNLSAVMQLLDGGLPVDAIDRHGMTALHHAVQSDHIDLARALLDRGADVNAVSFFDGDPHWAEGPGELGWTPLHYAKTVAMAELLIDRGADVNAHDRYKSMTPLNWAVLNGHYRLADYLISRSANIETSNRHGLTPLHNARGIAMTALLLDRGADANATSHYGVSVRKWNRGPLRWAALLGETSEVAQLIADGTDVNARDETGMTALHAAALRGHAEVAALLIEKDADVNARDNFDRTPLDVAANTAITRLLVAARAKAKG